MLLTGHVSGDIEAWLSTGAATGAGFALLRKPVQVQQIEAQAAALLKHLAAAG